MTFGLRSEVLMERTPLLPLSKGMLIETLADEKNFYVWKRDSGK